MRRTVSGEGQLSDQPVLALLKAALNLERCLGAAEVYPIPPAEGVSDLIKAFHGTVQSLIYEGCDTYQVSPD